MGMFDKNNQAQTDASFLNEFAGEGCDQIQQDDLKIPFLRILQKGSPQVDTEHSSYIPGAKAGMFFNTVTGELYGQEINLVPLKYKKVWLEWLPERQGLIGMHEPGSIDVDDSDFSKWLYNGNIIQETLLFYVLIENKFEQGPLVFALASTGIKHGKAWNTLIVNVRLPETGKQAPYFSSVWNLKTTLCKDSQYTWYQIGDKNTTAITRVRFITEEDFKTFINPVRQSLATIKPDVKQLEANTKQGETTEVPY